MFASHATWKPGESSRPLVRCIGYITAMLQGSHAAKHTSPQSSRRGAGTSYPQPSRPAPTLWEQCML